MKVHAPLISAPSEFRRAVWVFSALLVLVLLAGPSYLVSVQWWQAQSGYELGTLAISALVGIALGLLLGRDIWNLVARSNPLWLDLLVGALVLALFASLVYLRETQIWIWSFTDADGFVVSLIATMIAVTSLTERLKHVRVYAFARHLNFLYVRRDA